MSGRAAAVRNRLLVAGAAVLLAWLFGWTSDEGLLMLLVAALALVVALMRATFGGLLVLAHWVLRYRLAGLGLRELGDIIGEHRDDMRRAGLVVSQGSHRPWRRRDRRPRPLPDLVPRLRHRPYDGGIVVSLEAVRAGMSQDEILRALPRLRSAWGVDVVEAEAKAGGRIVEFRIPLTEQARADVDLRADDDRPAESDRAPRVQRVSERNRPPDAPPVVVVQASRPAEPRTETLAARRGRPPTIRPQLQPDDHGNYELTMLPIDAAHTFAPRPIDEPDRPPEAERRSPRTDEIPVQAARADAPEPPRISTRPVLNGGDPQLPTAVDERGLRIGAQWRTGKDR